MFSIEFRLELRRKKSRQDIQLAIIGRGEETLGMSNV